VIIVTWSTRFCEDGITPMAIADLREPRKAASSLVQNLASHDWLILGFFAIEWVALALGRGPGRDTCLTRVTADLVGYLALVALVRLEIMRWGGPASSLLYRLGMLGAVVGSYLQLREILPAVRAGALDERLYAFDQKMFGVEPAVWFDHFASHETTEWFAFFYFLYFVLVSAHVFPMLFWARDEEMLSQFGVGILLVFLSAHLMYMLVPGWGPYWYLSGSFHHELQGGTFWRLVQDTVEAGGAQKDIFPSLHTAAPTFFAWFSFRHRNRPPFKYTWAVIASLTTQIVIATMFLRWHYLIDVVAGLALAAAACSLGHRISEWERAKRARLGLQAAWTPLVYPSFGLGRHARRTPSA